MEEVLKQILKKLDKMELDVTAIKSDVRQVDIKMDSITEVVAKTMEDVTELKGKVDNQEVELKVIKGVE